MGQTGEISVGLWLAAALVCLACICLVFYYRSRGAGREQEKDLKEDGTRELAAARESAGIFEKMIPREFLKLLGAKSYSELSVGRQQYFSAVLLDVNKADFSGVVHNKRTEEVFASINRMLGKALPIIYGQSGLAESFEGGGISAVFPQKEEQALTAAVSLCEEVNALGDKEYDTVAAGLTRGTVMIGVVGHEERMTILLLSEAKEFAGFLRSIGHRYYARILASEEILSDMGDGAARFNYRTLGKIYLRSLDESRIIYDVFDGDRVEIRNKKRRTRIVFEKGVELYWKGRLSEARQHFVEVLKMDAADRAASFYLLRCDACLNGEETWREYMEIY